jgi:hypothetical protein
MSEGLLGTRPSLLTSTSPAFELAVEERNHSARYLIMHEAAIHPFSDRRTRAGAPGAYVPAAITVFRIGEEGRLTFAHKTDVELGGKFQWWSGFMGLA